MFKSIFISLILLLLSFQPVLAQSEFLTDYTVDYQVNANGLTHTKFSISLTNRLSNIYASEFAFSIGSTKLSQIKANDSSGNLDIQVNTGSKTTNIVIPFTTKVLGKDKSQVFNLEFDSADFANRLGTVWEITIPKLSQPNDLNQYNLTLSIPASFGQPAIISPLPISQTIKDNYTIYRFKTEDLLEKGISATFGQSQFFDFDLKYHLDNPNIFPVKTVITLPPDTAFQKIFLLTLDPRPESISVDQDGNWLANYLINSKQSLLVSATGSAQINLKPDPNYLQSDNINLADYLVSQPFWETDNPKIIKLAQELKTPDKIYSYIVSNLLYDYGRLNDNTTRFGAANALDNPDSAICMEFTDLFIALSRAAGIPARAINGYAYTTNSALKPLSLKKDVLHAWPEYYNQTQKIWQPVDPTWGNTTGGVDFFNHFDLNHFTLAILGKNSQYPAPAGAYKSPNSDSKDVQVEFGKMLSANPSLKLELKLPEKTLAGLAIPGQIIITNTGNVALYRQLINLSASRFKLTNHSWQIAALPPFAQQTIDFELPAANWLDNFTDTLTASSDLSVSSHQLTLKPVYALIFSKTNWLYLLIIALTLPLTLFMLKLFYEKVFKK